jgi:hypothetical protein
MNKKSVPPEIDMDILLLDPQKADVGVVGDICHRYTGHQPGKKGQY